FSLAFVLQGFNSYASAYFTGLNNGKISAIIAFSRTVVIETLAVFTLPWLFGAEILWRCQSIAEVAAAAVAITLLYMYRGDYCGNKV
ncbi:MAG: hypothetical protein II651_04405, partial [Selenomonas sp.]|nr:hypothetical protein [Selenomonas sp.]